MSNSRRASLLRSLEGSAKHLVEGASDEAKQDYEAMEHAITQENAYSTIHRIRAQNQLMNGLKPGQNEPLLNYGKRGLRVTRESGPEDATTAEQIANLYLDQCRQQTEELKSKSPNEDGEVEASKSGDE